MKMRIKFHKETADIDTVCAILKYVYKNIVLAPNSKGGIMEIDGLNVYIQASDKENELELVDDYMVEVLDKDYKLPKSAKCRQNYEIIAFVQKDENGEIIKDENGEIVAEPTVILKHRKYKNCGWIANKGDE